MKINLNRQKILMVSVLVFAFAVVATSVYAALTFTGTALTSDGALTITGVDDTTLTLTSGVAAEDLTISLTGATDSSLFLSSTGTGGDALTLTASAGGMLLDAAGVLELNSSAGVISIGNDAVAQNINIGTGVAARTITIGNVTTTTAVNINTGTGGSLVTTTGAGDFAVASADTLLLDAAGVLELNSSAGVISIGNDAVAQNINIGTGVAARTITIGNNTTTTLVDIIAGTDGIELTGDLVTKGTVPVATQSAGTPTITATSTDTAGTVTSDATSHTTVVVTFTNTYATAPACVISPGNAAAGVVAAENTAGVAAVTSTAALTITHAASTGVAAWHYFCIELE